MENKRPKHSANKLKRAGNRKSAIERYYLTAYPRHKIRRILDNNGMSAAQSWADSHGCPAFLQEIMSRRMRAFTMQV